MGIRIAEKMEWTKNTLFFHTFIILFSTFTTILAASISYEYFEKKFLNKKRKYETINKYDD